MKKSRKTIRLGIAVSSFNENITKGLLKGALKEIKNHGIPGSSVTISSCPGAFEIPFTAKRLCESGKYDAVICLGAVIKGETAHFEYISLSVAYGIQQLNLIYKIPVSFGILTCYTEKQAVKRSSDDKFNKGAEAARAVLSMIIGN